MNREDYQKVKQIFQSALDVAHGERAGYLNEKCSDNPRIRREVEKLLDSFESDYLEQPAIGKFAETIVSSKLAVGQLIGHYKIREKIGSGGMGEVYLAEDSTLDRHVAIKILPREFTEDAERVRRFVREAKFVSSLNHPNIVTIHEIGQSDGQHFIAAEYIEGETLREHLKRERLSLPSVLEISIQIASALEAAHGAGIIHRDIKPDNIMIRPDGLVKVLDFGIAKLIEQMRDTNGAQTTAAATEGTTPGMLVGTANYMSPEQARGLEIDERTDIFNFGIVLYEMVSGKRAFEGANTMDVVGAILHKEPLPLNQIMPELPETIERITVKSLKKNRTERYQTAKDLLIELKNLRRNLDIQGELEHSIVPDRKETTAESDSHTTQNVTSSSLEYAVAKVKQYKFVYLTLAVLVVAGIAFGIYKYSGSQPTNISFESAKITRLTNSGKVTTMAISPDGKWLAYANQDEDQQSLWLKQVAIPDSNTQIVPPAAVTYTGCAFSSDGNYLYYTVFEQGATVGTLYQVPVPGGTARKLFTDIWSDISFSPDGKQISYFNYISKDAEDRLMIANADGTEPRQMVVRKGNEMFISGAGAESPAWSPDGKTIATSAGVVDPRSWSVATVSVATGEINFFSSQKFDQTRDLNWLADGKSILILARENIGQPKNICQISYPSGEAKKISNDLNGYEAMSLTADSNTLAAVQVLETSNIWTTPIKDPAKAKQITSGSDANYSPSWTPDGKLVYSRNFGGKIDLYVVDSQGGSPKQLTSNAGANFSPTVSPDGRFIVFVSTRTGLSLWRIDIDGGSPKQLTNARDINPSFSPDGREIIFSRFLNKITIWKISIEGGEPVQLIDNVKSGNQKPKYSPDGKQFAIAYRDEQKSPIKLTIFPSSGGSPIKSLDLPPNADLESAQWMPDGLSIAYVINKGDIGNIWTQPLGGGTPKQITNFTSEKIWSFDFSRDGKQIAIARGTSTSDVVLISGIKK